MQAVILAGGEGTRLRPLTYHTPKVMMPLLNRPFLLHTICYLKKHGIKEVILALGYLSELIISHFGDGSGYGVRIIYSTETSPLGTAGSIKNLEGLLDGSFVVFNGDILTEIDLTAMIKRHQEIGPVASIALTPVDNPTLYGVVETDSQGMVKRFVEKPRWDKVTTNMINAGIYILEPEVLEYIPPSTFFMFEHHLFPLLLEKGEPILAYPSDAYWLDIGTPEKYLKAHHDLLSRWLKEVRVEKGAQIDPAAEIEGPVLIGEGCFIAEGVRIKGPAVLGSRCWVAEGVVIEGAVLWQGVRVEKGAVLKKCIIASGVHIQEDSFISEGCVLGHNVIVSRGKKLPEGTRLQPKVHLL